MRLGGSNKLLCAALQNSSLHIISYSASLLEARISCLYCGVFAFASGSYVIMPGQVMGGLDSERRRFIFHEQVVELCEFFDLLLQWRQGYCMGYFFLTEEHYRPTSSHGYSYKQIRVRIERLPDPRQLRCLPANHRVSRPR